MKKKSFLIAAITVLFLCQFTPLWTQSKPKLLEVIWKRTDNGLTYYTVSKQGRMVVMTKSNTNPNKPSYRYLVDLKTGENVYVTNPETERYIFANYLGDKFYVYDYIDEKLREYDTKTKEYIQYAYVPNKNNSVRYLSPDNAYFEWNDSHNAWIIKDLYTGMVLDSFKLPGSPNEPLYRIAYPCGEFTPDGRYVIITLSRIMYNGNSGPKSSYIYDRQAKEIIFKPINTDSGDLRYQYFNTSNKIAFAEEVQLPGDDKVYSYIRIFDPDSRTIVKDIRVESNYGFFISMDDKKLIYRQGSYNEVYDLENDKYLSYSHYTIHNGIILFDTNILYCYSNSEGISANRLDWTVGVEDETNLGKQILYPNPATDYIEINSTFINPTVNHRVDEGSDIKIFNTLGECVMTVETRHAVSLQRIDVSHLPRGVYYLRIGSRTQMFVKM